MRQLFSRAVRSGCLCLIVAVLWLFSPPCTGRAVAASNAKAIAKCQKTLNKAAQKIAKVKLATGLRCSEAMLACQLAEELDGQDFAGCAASATVPCEAKLAKIDALMGKLTGSVATKCEAVTHGDVDFNLRSRRGLGFDDAADACASLPPPASIDDLAAVADCVGRMTLCRSDDALELLLPRAYEVLNRSGVLAAHGTKFPCLDVRAASPSVAGSSSKKLLACQRAVHGAGQKRIKAMTKSVLACADGFLACQLPVDRLESDDDTGATCAEGTATKCDARLTKAEAISSQTGATPTTKCEVSLAEADAGLGFGAVCAEASTIAEMADCAFSGSDLAMAGMIGAVEPRTCALLKGADRLTGFEAVCIPSCPNGVVDAGEACDDGNADDFDLCRNDCTVGPTDYEIVSLPSTAAPANTPDGTPATSVDPGSTLATQFGSTTFDLNRALYTRYFAPGAGDPDAVLILIPGFAGGAGSFKYLAENLVTRAQAGGNLVLEVWAFDRRTNLLEDDAGAVLADSNHDPMLALDWYFGSELGLALSPSLPRRAVFHQGTDVAFLANWTPHVFARDIDAVVETARALSGSPKVFLGGHSLGTTFTARYAATDFDPGAGVTAGYAKLAGLVLLEGGGDSVAPTPPDADQLDLIIAKADGGLYHAVKNGDGRCVDGTPCAMVCVGGADDGQPCNPLSATDTCDAPGVCRGLDSDCTGVALPSGALSNKCVSPVEAYTGSNLASPLVLVTPQVHAAGDIVGVQGKSDPQGLDLIQKDFGAGAAVDVVEGLGILGILPRSSVETAVGFFLDDDFSPVSAFQASLGYSNNGFNQEVLGFVLPRAATVDPYRLWIDLDEPMPSAAVPNNGTTPTAVNARWGAEKEVVRVDVLFSFLRSGAGNFGDSYFASSGLSTTSTGSSTFAGGLDSTLLSVGRNRPDIENLTQAGSIDIPVIAFGGTNGLTPTTASFEDFAKSLGTCSAPSCDGTTARVDSEPDAVTTIYGGVNGGFEVHLSEGYAHIDVVAAEDDADNNVITPLLNFLERNAP